MSKIRDGLFLVFVLVFLGSALFHLAVVMVPSIQTDSPIWRHGLFVGINGLSAFLFWRRPWWAIPLLTVLLAQQCTSHGVDFWDSLQSQGPVRWLDGGIVAVLLLGLGCLCWESWSRKKMSSQSGGS